MGDFQFKEVENPLLTAPSHILYQMQVNNFNTFL